MKATTFWLSGRREALHLHRERQRDGVTRLPDAADAQEAARRDGRDRLAVDGDGRRLARGDQYGLRNLMLTALEGAVLMVKVDVFAAGIVVAWVSERPRSLQFSVELTYPTT